MDFATILCLETNPIIRYLLLSRRKRFHVNEIYVLREERGEYHKLFPQLLEQPDKFYEYMRMKKETFYYILRAISDTIEKQSNFQKCISPEERLVVTLRYLSTGLAFRSLAFSFRMAHNTIAGIVYDTCEAIWLLFNRKHMPFPTTEDFYTIARDYERLWNFPNCIGSIDGKHIRIKCPPKSGSMYFNYKKYFSVHLQGISDAHYKFITVDIGEYGRRSDAGEFTESNVFHHLENNSFNVPPNNHLPGTTYAVPYVFLGDQGYPLKEYLLRPYATTNDTDEGKENFNYRLSRARRCIECAFGILVSKWRCLKTELQMHPRNVHTVVKCACLLHNIIIDMEGTNEAVIALAMQENGINEIGINTTRRFNNSERRAHELRDYFKQHFINRPLRNV